MLQTTFERGMAEGQRKTVRMQLEVRFGPLSKTAIERFETCSDDRFKEMVTEVLDAQALKELGLED
jgi:hypothetical protein